jgi:murein L,D-transpeptidase YafK
LQKIYHSFSAGMVDLDSAAAVSLRKRPRKDNDWWSDGTGTVHQSGSSDLIRASFVRALTASAVLAGALTLAGCFGEESYQLPTKAMKELSPQTLALLEQKHMPKDSPILVRIFKEESELEVWKQDTTGRFQILKVYPICRWSGDLGPKVHEGDRQAPEGFYAITPDLMNPSSNYYLAINTGFPNAYDRANGRSGALLMIHGDCSSRGCYAMTDEQIGEIYSLARESFLGGQQSFQIQAYPFRMTALNMARHRTNPNMAFWRMIKEGNDHFEATHLEPKIDVCNRHYVFDAQAPANSTKSLVFNPTGPCPAFTLAPEIAGPVLEKERNDDAQYAQLVRNNVPTAPIRTGLDGGMNRVFLAQVGGSIPAAKKPPPDALPPQPPPAVTIADGSAQPTFASRMLGGLFGSRPAAEPAQVAATDSGVQERGEATGGTGGFFNNLFESKEPPASGASPPATATAELRKPKPTSHIETASASAAKPKATEPGKTEPQNTAAAKPKPATPQEQEASAAAPQPPATPPAANGSLINGAQAVVPAGSFASRWSGLQ